MQPITDVPLANPAGQTPLIGQVRRFGSCGVPYEVISILSPQEIRIRVLTTGEESPYAIAALLSDPED